MKINSKETGHHYKTSDLTLAITLSLYFPITSVDKADPRRVSFAFEKTKVLEEHIDKFWRRELRIEPLAFANQMKFLKTRIYSGD